MNYQNYIYFKIWTNFIFTLARIFLFDSRDGKVSRNTLFNRFFIGYVFMYNSSFQVMFTSSSSSSSALFFAWFFCILFNTTSSWSFNAFSNCYVQLSWGVCNTEKSEGTKRQLHSLVQIFTTIFLHRWLHLTRVYLDIQGYEFVFQWKEKHNPDCLMTKIKVRE